MIRFLRALIRFACAIFLLLMAPIISAAARNVLRGSVNFPSKLEEIPNSTESLTGSKNNQSGEPGLIEIPNWEYFRTKGDQTLEELKIRAQIFDWREIPAVPGKLAYFGRNYWTEC